MQPWPWPRSSEMSISNFTPTHSFYFHKWVYFSFESEIGCKVIWVRFPFIGKSFNKLGLKFLCKEMLLSVEVLRWFDDVLCYIQKKKVLKKKVLKSWKCSSSCFWWIRLGFIYISRFPECDLTNFEPMSLSVWYANLWVAVVQELKERIPWNVRFSWNLT